ncbi:MAG: hypothetical protein ACI9PN_001006 [Candidatus Azotimanducaceae bacterium]|jgi:hypothetical protein
MAEADAQYEDDKQIKNLRSKQDTASHKLSLIMDAGDKA